MIPPTRRIHLYPADTNGLEILILGEPEQIAPLVAGIRELLEHWIGFLGAAPIVMGAQVIGFRTARGANATHADPVAEAMLMLRRFTSIAWAGSVVYDPGVGLVGTW